MCDDENSPPIDFGDLQLGGYVELGFKLGSELLVFFNGFVGKYEVTVGN